MMVLPQYWQPIVDRLVFANHQIRFSFAYNTNGSTTFNALGPARLTVLFARGIVIDVAHQIDYLATDFFRSGCVLARMLVLLRNRQRRKRQGPTKVGTT